MTASDNSGPDPIRRLLTVRGLVQGVGFRPFVHRLAEKHGLTGWVRNGPEGVTIEVEGAPAPLAAFCSEIPGLAPPLAVVTGVEEHTVEATGDREFRVISSASGGELSTLPPPDVATCAACLAEMRDPADRRYRYPFLNCTDCGPRYTILQDLPYDRIRTGMRGFPLCPACGAEYEQIRDRRYHAEPIACPACGPHPWLADPHGRTIVSDDPIAEAARRLAAGEIVAVKGLGGFHLACSPGDHAAVARLRARKNRPDKPLAVMARDLATIRSFAELPEADAQMLLQWRRPIVLLAPRQGTGDRAGSDDRANDGQDPGPPAPPRIDPLVNGSARKIGVMLPYTPLHHLLLEGPCPVLVMTSGNRTDEPIARDNDEAVASLHGIADSFLLHNRPILNRADDSVARTAGRHPILLRRSRGFAPQPVTLPSLDGRTAPCVIAVGGDLKGACCLVVRGEAYPGPHVGDLVHPKAAGFLVESIETLIRLLGARPEIVVHDLHPDYTGTAIAAELAGRYGLARMAVQHHHAHGLACLAENRWAGPALAVALDGTGYGTDGAVWGGEILAVDGPRFVRAACLRPRRLPGGDRAALEPWRMALSVLHEKQPELAGESRGGRATADIARAPGKLSFLDGLDPQLVAGVGSLLQSDDCPRTTSAGRLFDAAAAILGLRSVTSFDGQAAMELEEAAARSGDRETYPYRLQDAPDAGSPILIDLGPTFHALLADTHLPVVDRARRFHTTLIAALVETCARLRDRTGLQTVALSGGVFQNAIILEDLVAALEAGQFRVFTQERVPPNDGGLALGQAWYGVLAGLERP